MPPAEKMRIVHRWSHKHSLTATLCLSSFAYGLCVAILGPTLLDIKQLVDASMKEVSYGFVVNQGAFCISSLIWGWAFNRIISRETGLLLALAICCCCTMAIPHIRSLIPLLIALCGLGTAFAGIDIATSAAMMEIWREKSNMYLQLLYFLASIGNTVSPLMSEPFLAPEPSPPLTAVLNTRESDGGDHGSKIYIPYSLCSGVVLLAIVFHIAISFQKRKSKKTVGADNETEMTNSDEVEPNANDGSSSENDVSDTDREVRGLYYWAIITLGALLFCFFICINENTRNYLQAFVVNCGLRLSKSKGSFMSCAFISSFTIGRLLGIFAAAKVPATTMLLVDFIAVLGGNVIVMTFASTWEPGLWIGFVMMGAGSASGVGAMYSILEKRINVNNFVCGIMMFGSALATTASPLFNGDFIESYPLVYVLINVSSISVCIVLFFAIFAVDFLENGNSKATNAISCVATD